MAKATEFTMTIDGVKVQIEALIFEPAPKMHKRQRRVSRGLYHATAKLNSKGRRYFTRLIKRAWNMITISAMTPPERHIARGCGPGGRRNSRVSRRIERALRGLT